MQAGDIGRLEVTFLVAAASSHGMPRQSAAEYPKRAGQCGGAAARAKDDHDNASVLSKIIDTLHFSCNV